MDEAYQHHAQRVALKSARATDFYVEHLSEYEHAVRRRARDPEVLMRRQAEDAARACDEPRAAADYPAGAAPPLVLIPFWGGLPQKGGNAHSKVSVEEKLLQLRGVACSVRNTFPGAALVVGVASAADEAYVAGAVNASEVLRLDVAHGAHLSFTLFRRVQELIDAGHGRYAAVDYVFFTEADQVLRAALSPRALVAALGRQVYVVPNRLEEPFPAGTSKDYATPQGRRLRFGQNMCNGELVATSDGRAAPAHPVDSRCVMKSRVQRDIIRYIYTFQSIFESSSSQPECFFLSIHSDSCNMGLWLCDSSIIAEIPRLTAAELLVECAAAFKSAKKLTRNGRARAAPRRAAAARYALLVAPRSSTP